MKRMTILMKPADLEFTMFKFRQYEMLEKLCVKCSYEENSKF